MKLIKNKILKRLNDPGFRNCHLFGSGEVKEVEDKLKDYYEKKFVVTFPNATTAIWALCLGLNIRRKTIVTSPFGWGGAIAPFLYLQNKITFTKVDQSLNIDFQLMNLKKNISCIFSVDVGGFPADTKHLKKIAKEKKLLLISDSSQSFGAYRDNKPAGYFADAIILSFTSAKTVNCLEGGAILSDDENIHDKLIQCSQHPYRQMIDLGQDSFNEFLPLNGRMNPVSALILNATFYEQLGLVEEIQKKYFFLYQKLLENNLLRPFPELNDPTGSTFFEFLVEPVKQNDELINKLNKNYPDFYFTNNQPIPFHKRNGFIKDFQGLTTSNEQDTSVYSRIKITLKT